MSTVPSRNGRKKEWSDLPSDLLAEILAKLSEMPDRRRFRSVCRAWRDAPQIRLPMQIPWLHLPYPTSTEYRYFYSLSEDRTYKLPFTDALGSSLSGSGNGDILSIKGIKPISATLLNPFTKTSRKLPPLQDVIPSPSYAGARRLVWDQLSDSTVFLMDTVDDSYLFYSRPGDLTWSRVNRRFNQWRRSMACHDRNIYVVHYNSCKTTVFDGATLRVLFEMPSPVQGRGNTGRLVQSSAELFLLVAHSIPPQFFKAFRLSRTGNAFEWSEVADIGNRAIFMDLSHGFLLEVPKNGRIKKSCIYNVLGPRRLKEPQFSIFNLADRRYEQTDGRLNGVLQATSGAFSPCWVVPNS